MSSQIKLILKPGFFILSSLRTAAHIVEEYNAARTAKLRALEAQQAGDGDQFLLRARLRDIDATIERLEREYQSRTGSAMAINVGIIKRD